MATLLEGVELWSEARRELVDAFSWYEERNTRAAVGFLNEIERVCREIIAAPGLGSRWPGLPVRRALLRRYPYSVIYLPRATIEIVAISHDRRRPGYWKDRL